MTGLIDVSLKCSFFHIIFHTQHIFASTSSGKKNDAPRKRDRKSSGQSSTSWASPRTTRSRSKPKRKVEGSTNDNAITIDSSSDESSAEDMEIDACSVLPEEFEDDEPIHEV